MYNIVVEHGDRYLKCLWKVLDNERTTSLFKIVQLQVLKLFQIVFLKFAKMVNILEVPQFEIVLINVLEIYHDGFELARN